MLTKSALTEEGDKQHQRLRSRLLDALLAERMIRERKYFPFQQPEQKSAFKYSIKGYVLYCFIARIHKA